MIHPRKLLREELDVLGTHHDVTYGSPRLGVEVPLGKNDSVALEGGYLFFTSHASDLNSWALYFMHRHKF